MRQRTSRVVAAIGAAALAVGLLAPVGALATTNEPIAQTGGMTATLPLFGTTLTVDVTLDAVGNIAGVALTPPGDLAKTKTEPSVVKFANAAGTTTVSVKAKRDKLAISAKSAKLDDLVGAGSWAADVFGTGATSTVAYTIGKDGSGNPTLAFGAVTPASGVTAEVGTPKSEVKADEASASGKVTFGHDGYVKSLKISVEVDKLDGHANLKITLSGKDRQTLPGSLADLAGPRTWSAHLCDGTPVAVNYHVTADAKVAYDGATGAPATARTTEHGLKVRFDGTKVGVNVELRSKAAGTYTLVVKGSSGSCGKGHSDVAKKGDNAQKGHSDVAKKGDNAQKRDRTRTGDRARTGGSVVAGTADSAKKGDSRGG